MPYLGRPVTNAGQFEIIDDISSSFNGSNTSFTLQVGGTNIQPDSANVTIALDGIIQIPSTAYSITGSTLNFSEAPESGTGFHGVLAGQSQFIESNFITDTHIKSTANISGSKINTDFSAQNIQITHITSSGNISGSSSSTISAGTFTGTFSGAVSSSVLSSPSQGTVRLATNGVNTDVDTGLQSGDSPTFTGGTITGNLLVGGTITAQEVHTEFESASVIFTSGSTIFGNSSDDVHNMTGSLNVSGAINLKDGNLSVIDKMIIGSGSGFDFSGTNHSFTVKSSGNNSGFSVLSSAGGELLRFIQESNDSGKLDIFDGGSLKLRLSAHANESSYINNGGKFGIGTASPSYKLHVADDTANDYAAYIINDNADGSGLRLRCDDSDGDEYLFYAENSTTARFSIKSDGKTGIGTASPTTKLHLSDGTNTAVIAKFTNDTTGNTINDGSSIGIDGDGDLLIYNVENKEIKFYTNDTLRAVIDNGGNLGINETNPAAKMDIDGDIQIRNANALLLNHTGGGASDTYINSPADNVMAFRTGGTERMRIHSDGRISIKSATLPQDFGGERGQVCISSIDNAGANNYAVLQLQGHSITNDAAIGGIYFYDHSNNNAIIQASRDSSTSSADLIFYTNGGSGVAEGMRLDSVGNLGIGRNSSGARLETLVNDNEFAAFFISDNNSGSSATVAIRADSSSGDRKLVAFYNGGTNIANITYNGGTATYGTGSDRRLKTNIIDFKDGLSILNKVEVKKFDWITGRKQDVGIVAQDLYNTIPKVIVKGDDNETDIEQPWQVDYPRLVPYLINAVQELSSEITDLKKEVKELKS